MKMNEPLVQSWMLVCMKYYAISSLLPSSFCVNLIIICYYLLVHISGIDTKKGVDTSHFTLMLSTLP